MTSPSPPPSAAAPALSSSASATGGMSRHGTPAVATASSRWLRLRLHHSGSGGGGAGGGRRLLPSALLGARRRPSSTSSMLGGRRDYSVDRLTDAAEDVTLELVHWKTADRRRVPRVPAARPAPRRATVAARRRADRDGLRTSPDAAGAAAVELPRRGRRGGPDVHWRRATDVAQLSQRRRLRRRRT